MPRSPTPTTTPGPAGATGATTRALPLQSTGGTELAAELAGLLGRLVEQLDVDEAAIYGYDPLHRNLVALSIAGKDGTAEPGGHRIGLGAGPIGRVARTRRPDWIRWPRGLPNSPVGRPGPGAWRAFLGIPLIYQSHLLGVLAVVHLSPVSFLQRDLAVAYRSAQAIAGYLATHSAAMGVWMAAQPSISPG